MDRKKCKEQLLMMVDVTDDANLIKLLPGRGKYGLVTKRPKKFPGKSVIHNISEDSANALGLPDRIRELRAALRTCPKVYRKFAFVAERSFHITTFDLINKVEHGKKLRPKYRYEQVSEKVEKEALKFLAEMQLTFAATVKISEVGMFGSSGVLKLTLEFTDTVRDVFQAYRLGLHKYLGMQVGCPYWLVRDPFWDQKLAAHLTIGYLVQPLTVAEIDRLLDIIKEFNNTHFEPIIFELTQGEVTGFNTMDDYFVVQALP